MTIKTIICASCGKTRKSSSRLCGRCKQKKQRLENPTAYYAWKARTRARQRDSNLCMYCHKKPKEDGLYCSECRRKAKDKAAEKRLIIKTETIDHYGKICACCGEHRRPFLTLDHINGGGNKQRAETGQSGVRLYRWLQLRGYPEGYQVLCWNCNCAKGYFGSCPHQTTEQIEEPTKLDTQGEPKPCIRCGRVAFVGTRCWQCKILERKEARDRRWSIKVETLGHYGSICACCGELEPKFLSIDHILGGGNTHRKQTGGGVAFYYWLKKQNYPEGYRVLCYNCNCAIGAYGKCPHELERISA